MLTLTRPVILGSANLDKYVKEPQDQEPELKVDLELDKEITNLEKLLHSQGTPLGIEVPVHNLLNKKLQEAKDKKEKAKEERVRNENIASLMKEYHSLDTSFLEMTNKRTVWGNSKAGWRNSERIKVEIEVPRFSVYSLDSSEFSMNYKYKSSKYGSGGSMEFEITPKLPSALKPDVYSARVKIAFEEMLLNQESLEFISRFNGLIPPQSKGRINKAIEKEHFPKSDIYIITETKPEEWDIQARPEPRLNGCPLIVGIKYDTCFLIDKFDTTPIEEYVSREFSSGRL